MTTIRKAVFPVAGLGTRFLPATKASPKEMMPIVDKPLIQYAVEEAIAAGINELIFVTSSGKRTIEDHFDSQFELEYRLREQGKTALLKAIQDIVPHGVSCVYVRQSEALGLGHAVLCAKRVIGDEPFAVLLADDLIDATPAMPCLKQMALSFQKSHMKGMVAVQPIALEQAPHYGVVAVAEPIAPLANLLGIVEKPQPSQAPSRYGVVGRYILPPEIWEVLENLKPGRGSELQLTDAIAVLLEQYPMGAFAFEGKRYDCGSKLGYLMATVEYGLQHEEIKNQFAEYLNKLSKVARKLEEPA